eukprot:GHVL01044033.1.p1 GENE.GHVL01044033.1~~GHVL01044033.1.p1  ORF type:complete len:236 (+),score=22.68 GHVL01044033.1:84-791(+)
MEKKKEELCLYKDGYNIIFIFILYVLQGLPIGLSSAIPYLLIKHTTYSQIAIFNLVLLPFSFKLFWAPIVDSTSLGFWGRRKSWLIPVQSICGIVFIFGYFYLNDWIGGVPNVRALTIYFGILFFLTATQDIVVDGWALNMLSPENKTVAPTLNVIGQTIGVNISYLVFLSLNDPDTCNRLFRWSNPSSDPIITLSGFSLISGFAFLFVTFFVIFKNEKKTRWRSKDSGSEIDDL